LKQKCDGPLSSVTFNLILCRYIVVGGVGLAAALALAAALPKIKTKRPEEANLALV
jgi:hypothetical protein